MKKKQKIVKKIKRVIGKIMALVNFLIIFTTPFMPILQNVSYAEQASAEEATAGRDLGEYRITTYCYQCNDDGAGNFGTQATASGNPATEHHSAAIDINGDINGLKLGDRVRIGNEVYTIEDYGAGPDKSTFKSGVNEFLDLYVSVPECCGGESQPYAEYDHIYLLDGTTGDQNQTAEEAASNLIDYTAYIKVCGSKKDGYYLNFVDDIDEKIQEKIDSNPSLYRMYNISVDTVKTMIKAEIATKFPDFGEGIDVSDITGISGSRSGATSGTSHYNVSGEFAWPIAGQNDPAERAAAITSLRSEGRVHPVFGGTRPHEGMDIGVDSGHEIIAIASGTVTTSGESGGYGNLIEITHDDKIDGQTWTSKYGHNSVLLVPEGTHVNKGDVVALAGSTGWSTGPHCHLQIEINGEVVDPLEFYSEDEVNGPGTGDYAGVTLKGLKPKGATKSQTTNTGTNTTTNTAINTTSSTNSTQANNNSGTLDVVAAAQKVHQIIENGYSYANDNSYETVEESEAAGQKTVDCSTYVDWVLHEIGLNIDNRYCPNLQAELDSATWCTRVDQSQAQAGDIVLFYGHVQMYGGKAEDGSDMWYNAGSDAAISMSAPPGRGMSFSDGVVGIYHINDAAISSNGATMTSSSSYITNSNNIKEGNREEAFQGAVNMRRVTPNLDQGEFNTELGDKDYTDTREGEEGRGTKKDIPLNVQMKLKQVSCKSNTSIDFSELQYLEIPYVNFWGDIKTGTMIVNRSLADEVLDIFQELYNIKYPIENMQIIDNYYSPDRTYVTARAPTNNRTSTSGRINQQNTTTNSTSTNNKNTTTSNTSNNNTTTNSTNNNKNTTNKTPTTQTKSHTYTIRGTSDILKTCQRDDNAYSFYYEEGGAHATGNAIDINPFINPIVQNGNATSQTESRFLTRTTDNLRDDNERNALLTKESQAVKIFEKYGWTWGGDSTDSTVAYGHFEKPLSESTTTHIEGIESKVSDLSFVPKDIFDALVQQNDDRALQTFTLDSSFNIIVASWSYSNGIRKITTGSTLDFRKGLNKYTMPVELLAAILIDSDDAKFTEELAKLGANSEYVIAVEDSVTLTKTKIEKKEVVEKTTETQQVTGSINKNTNGVENFLFIGDSITEGMDSYGVADVNCTFRGVTSKTAAGWINDFERLKGIENVAGINVMLGTNDFEDGDTSITNLKELLEKLHEEYPNVQIYVDKILPTAEGSEEKRNEYNSKLETLGLSYVKVIDPSNPLPELEPDGTHPTANGSKTLWNNIKTQIQGGGTSTTTTSTTTGDTKQEGITDELTDNITEQVTQKADVTYIDCWFIKMQKENTYKEVAGEGRIENVQGIVTRDDQDSTTNVTEDETNNTTSSTTTASQITTITYEYLESNYRVIGNSKKFLELYNDTNKYEAKRNIYIPFLEDYLNQYEATVNQVDIMKYLVYQGRKFSNYGTATLNFNEDFAPDDMTPSSSASGTGNASGTLNITGGNVEQKVWNALKGAGYSDVATAAVMGNIYGESNFNPGALEGGVGPGFGLCQWTDPEGTADRRTRLEQFAASRGVDPSNEDIQIEYLIGELTPGGGADGFAWYQFGGYESERTTWMTTTDIGEATTAFCAGFERPSVPRNETRIQAAQGYLAQYAGQK